MKTIKISIRKPGSRLLHRIKMMFCLTILASLLLTNTVVFAEQLPVTNVTNTLDGYSYTFYASCDYNSNPSSLYARAYTRHPITSSKTAKMDGFYRKSGETKPIYGTEAVSFTTADAVSSIVNLSGYQYCGYVSKHSAYYIHSTGVVTYTVGITLP